MSILVTMIAAPEAVLETAVEWKIALISVGIVAVPWLIGALHRGKVHALEAALDQLQVNRDEWRATANRVIDATTHKHKLIHDALMTWYNSGRALCEKCSRTQMSAEWCIAELQKWEAEFERQMKDLIPESRWLQLVAPPGIATSRPEVESRGQMHQRKLKELSLTLGRVLDLIHSEYPEPNPHFRPLALS